MTLTPHISHDTGENDEAAIAVGGKDHLRLLGLAIVAGVVVAAWKRPDRALNIAMASASETLCSGVFVSHLEEKRVFAESVASQPGLRPVLRGMKTVIDGNTVTVRWHGGFEAKTTYYPGYGCALPLRTPTAATLAAARALPPAPTEPPVQPGDAADAGGDGHRLRRTRPRTAPQRARHRRAASRADRRRTLCRWLHPRNAADRLFTEQVRGARTGGHPGAPASPGHRSAGARCRMARCRRPASCASPSISFCAWKAAWISPKPIRASISVSRMMFATRDMASYAASAPLASPPGTRWEYHQRRHAHRLGHHPGHFRRRRPRTAGVCPRGTVQPLGMEHVLMEFDGAQSLIGSTRVYASGPRLGAVGSALPGRRRHLLAAAPAILPEGWAASAGKRTLGALYGSGFWSNVGQGHESMMACRTMRTSPRARTASTW